MPDFSLPITTTLSTHEIAIADVTDWYHGICVVIPLTTIPFRSPKQWNDHFEELLINPSHSPPLKIFISFRKVLNPIFLLFACVFPASSALSLRLWLGLQAREENGDDEFFIMSSFAHGISWCINELLPGFFNRSLVMHTGVRLKLKAFH